MTGSMKWMVYEANNGDTYAVFIDESAGIAGSFDDFTPTSVVTSVMPRYFDMRYVNLVRKTATETQRSTLAIGDPDVWAGYDNGGIVTIDGVQWSVSSTRGEKRRVPVAQDTELDDGTPELLPAAG